jgi:glutamate synthase domain-containing protein 3
MLNLSAANLDFTELNKKLRGFEGEIQISDCYGQRYIAAGLGGRRITINGTPGNALAAYMDGAEIIVNGNVQDAVGDTMNDGKIVVNGSAGDALGYGMRGGVIYVRGQAGYRTGIHMKEYKEKKPLIIIGEKVGSFLGEYMAGGTIIVLGIGMNGELPVGNFTGTGMHGGTIYVRTDKTPQRLPAQVLTYAASETDLELIREPVIDFAEQFSFNPAELLSGTFYVLRPNAKNPYHTLYTPNMR